MYIIISHWDRYGDIIIKEFKSWWENIDLHMSIKQMEKLCFECQKKAKKILRIRNIASDIKIKLMTYLFCIVKDENEEI